MFPSSHSHSFKDIPSRAKYILSLAKNNVLHGLQPRVLIPKCCYVPKVCLEGMVNIIKLFPLPIQLSHMFVTLALVRRGRVGVMESILGALLALLEGHSPKQTCLDITWLAIEGQKC